MTRTIRLAVALFIGLGVTLMLPAGAANAASAYRYWSYFHASGTTWEYYPKGPAETKPADGSVEGWRFAVQTDPRAPRATVTFDDVCGDTKAASGKKRVAVVIDYGRAADSAGGAEPPAPVAKCASVPAAATGQEVLVAVADLRQDKGLICGIDGYPATGCGDEVKQPSAEVAAADTPVTLKPAAKATTENADDGSNTGTYVGIGIAAVVVIAVGAVALRRRTA